MLLLSECSTSLTRQRGQVLAEAVVVMLLLVILIGALHQIGRWQHQWATNWLSTQVMATAWSLDHDVGDTAFTVDRSDRHAWHNWVMADYGLGKPNWYHLRQPGRFSKSAWRLSNAGQASLDRAVTAHIEQAPRLWARQALASKTVVRTLMPSIKSVDSPWRDRGSATDWLGQWQGSTPAAYLKVRP